MQDQAKKQKIRLAKTNNVTKVLNKIAAQNTLASYKEQPIRGASNRRTLTLSLNESMNSSQSPNSRMTLHQNQY